MEIDFKEKYLRYKALDLLPVFLKLKIPVEVIVLFRMLFALLVAIIFLLGNHLLSLIFLTIYQFVFLLDYIDGELARKQHRFSLRWVKFDHIFHYIASFLFLLTLSIGNFESLDTWVFYSGLFASVLVILTMFLGIKQFKKIRLQEQDYKGRFSKIYSFLVIYSPFSL